jgi:hypothetical protein
MAIETHFQSPYIRQLKDFGCLKPSLVDINYKFELLMIEFLVAFSHQE